MVPVVTLIIHVITVLFISLAGQGEVPVQRSADLLGADAQPGFLLSPPHPEHPPTPHQLQSDTVLSANHPGAPPWGPDAQGGRCKGTRSGEDKSVGLDRRGAGRGRIPRRPRSPYAPRRVCAFQLPGDSTSPGPRGSGLGIGPQLPPGAADAKPGWSGWARPAPSRQRKWRLHYIRPPRLAELGEGRLGVWKNKRKSPCTM